MIILRGIFVIALCTSFFYEAVGQATCALSWDNGTSLSDTSWSFGLGLDIIEDVTPVGTVVLNLVATDISVIRSSTTTSSADGHIFMEPALENGRFTLTLTNYFAQYEELETSSIIRMSVIFGCSVNDRTLELTQSIIDTNNNYPEFLKAPYTYELPMPFPSGFDVQLYGEIAARDIDLTNTGISFTLNSSDPNANGFLASCLSCGDGIISKVYYAQLLTTIRLSLEKSVTFQIFATDTGTPPLTSQTSITITVDEENSTPNNPVFTHPVYIADHSDLTIEEASGTLVVFDQGDIGLSQGIDSTVEYTITDNTGSYHQNFGITISPDYSYISITLRDVTEKLLAEKYVILTLTATRPGAMSPGVTIVHIDLPGIISCTTTTVEPITGTTTITSESSTTSSTVKPTTSTTPSLSFANSIYRLDKESSFIGVLMTQTAVATNAEGTIIYSAIFDDDDLASRIMIDPNTAELEVTAAISPGIYTFQITATIQDLSLSTSANVVLVISTLTECSGEIVFGYALQIIELDEESAHENVLPLDDNGCSYTIYSQTPNQDLFSINGNTLNTVSIDREASYFSEMSVAQVRVIIDAICPKEPATGTRSKRDTEYEVLTGNIAYERTRTTLVVIINDINDNPPIWNSDTPTYVGFPSYELAQLIHVPYVYQFSATDADIGDNAKVIYTLPIGSDEVFYVHNTVGTLYIQQGVYIEDGSQFKIIATDGSFETPTELTVKTLTSDNVVVLFITGGVLEDVDNIVQELSTSTGYWIRSLGSAVIPESDTPSSRSLRSVSHIAKRIADPNTLLRLVVYGLENNEPVSSETLVSELGAAQLTWAISDSATLGSILSDNKETTANGTNTSGFWTAIIVLSVLLFVILIAVGVVYYLSRRPKKPTSVESDVNYETFENRSSNGSTGKDFAKSVTLGESQDNVTESTDSPNDDWMLNQTKNTEKSFFETNVTFNPLKRSKDHGDLIFITRNESVTAEISPKPPRKKSVAFKTTVEEIEVSRL